MSQTSKLLAPSLRTSYDSLREVLAEQINPTEELQNALVNPFGFLPVGNIIDFMDCLDDEVIAEGPAECLSGDTILVDPITGEENTVKWYCDHNKRPWVMTLGGIEQAGVPFKKGYDVLYRVITEDGNYFDATAKHLILTEDGFCFVGELRSGQYLSVYSQDLQVSRPADDQLFNYTVQSKRVISIENIGAATFYDLTVNTNHHYFAQGFIHHNTGKTLAALNKLHRTACRYAGCQLSIIRKTYKSMAGSVLMTYENKVLGSQSQVGGYGGSRPSWYDYPNGSRIWIDGMDEPTRVLSSERDIIYVNQAEELSLIEWQTLSTRVTGRAGNIPNPQLIGDCNPGAPTHWIKSRAKQGNLTLIHTGHKDNPTLWDTVHEAWTKQGERTLRKLSKLTGTMRLRLLNGMWAQPEGAIYNMFLEETHKVESFYPNVIWPRVVGIDPIGANIAAVWLAYDPIQGILNAYREYTEPFGISTPQHVDNLLGLSRGEGIFAWVAGAVAERQARVDLNAYGIPAMPPPVSDVWTGIDRIIQLLQDCKLVIHDSCPGLLSEIGAYSRRTDPRTGRVEDEIADKETYHLLDALRYAVVWLTTPMEERRDVVYSPIPIGLEY